MKNKSQTNTDILRIKEQTDLKFETSKKERNEARKQTHEQHLQIATTST